MTVSRERKIAINGLFNQIWGHKTVPLCWLGKYSRDFSRTKSIDIDSRQTQWDYFNPIDFLELPFLLWNLSSIDEGCFLQTSSLRDHGIMVTNLTKYQLRVEITTQDSLEGPYDQGMGTLHQPKGDKNFQLQSSGSLELQGVANLTKSWPRGMIVAFGA